MVHRLERRVHPRLAHLLLLPCGLGEASAAAAAAAADAARQYLEHLRADERFLGAEDAEEAIAHAAACGVRGLDWDAEEAVARAAACGLD